MSVFPQKYLLEFIQYVSCDPRFHLITYDDLDFQDDFDYENAYPEEYARWNETADKSKIHLLIQYDVDSHPQRAVEMIKHHVLWEAPITVMLRRMVLDTIMYVPKGCIVGYHCDTYERSEFDIDKAHELFVEDVVELEKRFGPVKYWSPHGGKRSPDGKSNAHVIKTPKAFQHKLRWVHNKYTVRFDRQFTDGGITSTAYSAKRDLTAFVELLRPGGRYRVLVHPQYYTQQWSATVVLKDEAWYQHILKTYEEGGSVWGLY
jgi:hypothetical protein